MLAGALSPRSGKGFQKYNILRPLIQRLLIKFAAFPDFWKSLFAI
jgi:hypothetical protein